MDTSDDVQRDRLFRAMEMSWRKTEPFRKLTAGLVQEYAGPNYGEEGARPRYETLLNLMNQAVDAYTLSLAANRPRILLTTKFDELKFFAKKFEVATNNLIQEIELEQTLRQAVLNAFFCVGIVKVHMADSVAVQLEENLWMDPGIPFASNISLDNWVHDMSASKYSSVKYAADSYRIPFEDLKKDIFDQKATKHLVPSSKYDVYEDDDRQEAISRGFETDQDEFEPMIDVFDCWIPRDNKIYTWAMNTRKRFQGIGKPIAVMDANIAEFGPYHLLNLGEVPENILPSSPASHLTGLMKLVNNLMRKQSRQAKRQRDVHVYDPASAEAAKRIHRSSDGDWVEANPQDVGVIKMGGVDASNQAFMIGTMSMFDRMAGNLSAQLGLGPQSDTATQDSLIYGAVNKKEASMQIKVQSFTTRIIRDLGYMLWKDSVKTIPGKVPLEGTTYSFDADWTPEDREGDFFDYNFDIDVFSMSYQSPAQRVKALTGLITGVYAPMAEVLMKQGGMINFQSLTDIYAELLNLPRLKEVIQFANPSQKEELGPSGSLTKPQNTTREYIRKSVSTGGTEQGKAHVQQQSWLDSGQNNEDQDAGAKPY